MDEKKMTQQPEATPQMAVAPGGGNRNARNIPVDNEGKRDWNYGLFDCFGDMHACCLACWCPCLLHGQNKRRLAHLNQHNTPDPNRTDLCSPDGWIYGCIEVAFDMGWILQIATRGAIRERYNIRGSPTDDCCAAFCCQPCDLVQGSRELSVEEESFGPTA